MRVLWIDYSHKGANMGNTITIPGTPVDPDKRCSKCKWHHDLSGATESKDVKNCLALPYPACTVTFSTGDAVCNYPHLFLAKDKQCK